jgi:hypothetical protein
MNAWLVAAIVAVLLFLTSCKCACAWWATEATDPFSDYVYSDFNAKPKPVDPLAEADMCPCGYKKGPVVYTRNSRARKMTASDE